MPLQESYNTIEDMLAGKGWYVTTISGVSMFPMLRNHKDQVLVKPLEGRLKPYDVAVYRATEKYIVHRVLKVCEGYYIIRGDNCVNLEYIPDRMVIGKVTGFWRRDRFIEVTNKNYIRYAHFWVAINPLVKLAHFPRILASRIFHKIFGDHVHLADLKQRILRK